MQTLWILTAITILLLKNLSNAQRLRADNYIPKETDKITFITFTKNGTRIDTIS